MASAHLEFPIAEEEQLVERHEDSDMPIAIMPHREYSGKELDGIHPSIISPDDEALEDTQKDDDDCVFRHRTSPARHGEPRAEAEDG